MRQPRRKARTLSSTGSRSGHEEFSGGRFEYQIKSLQIIALLSESAKRTEPFSIN